MLISSSLLSFDFFFVYLKVKKILHICQIVPYQDVLDHHIQAELVIREL